MLTRSKTQLQIYFEYFFAFIPWIILPFSAPLAFFTGLLILFFLSFFYPSSFVRSIVALCIIVGGGVSYPDSIFHSDMANYHSTYTKLFNGNLDALFDYGMGVEFVLPLMWLLLSSVIGYVEYIHFGMLHSVIAALLFYIWLEKYGVKDFDAKKASICIFLSLLLFDYWECAWLMRQFFSGIFVLFALSQTTKFRALIFFLLAFFCHTSALIFFIIFYCLKTYPKLGMSIVVCICVLMAGGFLFPILFSYTAMLPDFLSHKLTFYESSVMKDAVSIRIFVILGFLVAFGIIYRHKIDAKWRYIVIGYGIMCLFADIVWNHFFIRIALLGYFTMLGFLLFLAFQSNIVILYIVCGAMFFDKVRIMYIAGVEQGVKIPYLLHYGLSGDWFYFLLN